MPSAVRRLISRAVWPDAPSGPDRVICHEWLTALGGSDRVAVELARITDATVIFTFALDDDFARTLLTQHGVVARVVTWRGGRWAGRRRGRLTLLLPIMPIVWRSLDLSRARLVVSSSHACVKAIRAPRHVSYCHTPMRYAWEWRLERDRLPRWAQPIMPIAAAVFRRLDRRWARSVDVHLANSRFVAERVRRAYGVEAVVVPPPVRSRRLASCPRPDRPGPFVTAGRFVPYKRFDLAIEAANLAGVDLVLAGDGPDRRRLERLAGPTIRFVIGPDDDRLAELLASARALVFCGVEDFGILPVEAQATGTPVIARGEGGAIETVVEGQTGVLVRSDRVDEWADALRNFDPDGFDPEIVRAHALTFDTEQFARRILDPDQEPGSTIARLGHR